MKNQTTFLKKMLSTLVGLGISAFSFVSCEEETATNKNLQVEGIYIVNEGNFLESNGSITLLNPETGDKIDNYFNRQNGRFPGDVVQDLAFAGDKGFIVVNNSKRVEVVDKDNFSELDVIPQLSYPRQFMQVNNNYGYLTNGSSADSTNGHVFKIDLDNHTIADTIEVGRGPESMMMAGSRVYVANSGGFIAGNTVSIIDPANDQVVKTITVGDMPTDMVEDKNGDIWVMCKGLTSFLPEGPTNASLVKIDGESHSTTSFDLGKSASHGLYLLSVSPNKNHVYFVGKDGIYRMSIDATKLPGEPVIGRAPYGLDINPENGRIYCLEPGNGTKGYAFRYDSEHQLIDSVQVGYSPNAVVFE